MENIIEQLNEEDINFLKTFNTIKKDSFTILFVTDNTLDSQNYLISNNQVVKILPNAIPDKLILLDLVTFKYNIDDKTNLKLLEIANINRQKTMYAASTAYITDLGKRVLNLIK